MQKDESVFTQSIFSGEANAGSVDVQNLTLPVDDHCDIAGVFCYAEKQFLGLFRSLQCPAFSFGLLQRNTRFDVTVCHCRAVPGAYNSPANRIPHRKVLSIRPFLNILRQFVVYNNEAAAVIIIRQ